MSTARKTTEGTGGWSDGSWNKGKGVTIPKITKNPGSPSGSGTSSTAPCRGRGMLWKPNSEKGGLVCLFKCGKAPDGVKVNGLEMVYYGQNNGNRAHYRPPNVGQKGATFGNNVRVTGYGNTWIVPVGANRWEGGPGITTTTPPATTNPGNDDTNDDSSADPDFDRQ